MAGVTSTGFIAKTISDLQNDLRAAARRVFGAQANVDPRARVGQLVTIFSERLSEIWELAEVVAGALDPNGATGVLLDHLCALTGTFRQPASRSTVSVVFVGTAGTVLAVGRQVGVTGTSTVFETTAAGTITAAPAWAASTPYALGVIVQSGGVLWRAAVGGTSSTVAPSGAGPVFVDGTVTWQRLVAGSAFALVPSQATVTGPLQGFALSVTTIVTPVAGLAAVINPLDAIPGRDLEADSSLRLRRQQDIAGIGSSPLGAILAKVSNVAGVSSASIFENVTDVTVGTIGPHGIEVLVEGGLNSEIGEAIVDAKAAGIATFGTTTHTSTLSNGNPVEVRFSRPSLVAVWVGITLTKDDRLYPINGDALVREAIVNFGDSQALGRDVVGSAISAAIFAAVPGVLDVAAPLLGLANPPVSSTPLIMTIRQRADYDTSRITVASVSGTP